VKLNCKDYRLVVNSYNEEFYEDVTDTSQDNIILFRILEIDKQFEPSDGTIKTAGALRKILMSLCRESERMPCRGVLKAGAGYLKTFYPFYQHFYRAFR
jgi:hypothetical protein